MIIYIYIILWNVVKYIKKSLKYVLIHDTWSREILWPNCQGAIAWCWGGTSNWHDNWSPCLADLAENMAENTTATGHLSDSVSMPLACPQEWCPNQSTSERRSSAAILVLEPQSSLLGPFVLTSCWADDCCLLEPSCTPQKIQKHKTAPWFWHLNSPWDLTYPLRKSMKIIEHLQRIISNDV